MSKTPRCSPGAAATSTISACGPARCTPRSCARRTRTRRSARSTLSAARKATRRRGRYHRRRGHRAVGEPLLVGVKAPIECWPIAVERVRYVGEPVAVVVAADRYLAEDALELIEVDYEPLPRRRRPAAALDPEQPVLHEGLGSNIASDRSFRYGDPERAFARAAHRVSVDGPLSAQFLHADRNLRRWSPTTIRARTPTTSWRTSRGRSACTR